MSFIENLSTKAKIVLGTFLFVVSNGLIMYAVKEVCSNLEFSISNIVMLPSFAIIILINSIFYEEEKRFAFIAYGLTLFAYTVLFVAYLNGKNFRFFHISTFFGFMPSLVCFVFYWFSLLKSRLKKGYCVCNFFLALTMSGIILQILMVWGYYLMFDAWISTNTIIAIFQTNFKESLEFLQQHGLVKISCIIVAFISVLLWLGYQLYQQADKLHIRSSFHQLTLVIALFLNMLVLLGTWDNLLTFIYKDSANYLASFNRYMDNRNARMELAKTSLVLDKQKRGLYVVVIGESQTRNNMSLYGYERNTTPWLKQMQEKQKLIRFDNAFSCNTYTVATVPFAITARNQYNKKELWDSLSILEGANLGGFKTMWLSNQVKFGLWDTPITMLGEGAEIKHFINEKNFGKVLSTEFFDNKLVEVLKNENLDGNRLVVIHLMGNHARYSERYEKEFKKYPEDNNKDHYDNSIVYNDYVLGNIYELVSKQTNFMGLIYFSDHGENVHDGGHNYDKFTNAMVEIPFCVLLSDKYIENNQDLYDAMLKNRKAYFTNDLIYDCVISLMGIRIEGQYEANNDITSSSYDGNPERLTTIAGEKKLSDLYK